MVNSGGLPGSDPVPRQPTAAEIADDLAARIRAGEYRPGQHLHFAELAELYGVSRATIRRATWLLRYSGLAYYQPGRGVFVEDIHPSG